MNSTINTHIFKLFFIFSCFLYGVSIPASAKEELLTQSKQLTFEGLKSGEGYYSSDGKKMIFQSERYPGNPFYQMYIIDLKSGKLDKISPGNGKTTCGWIHPNLKKAMWSSTHLDKDWKEKENAELEQRKKPVQNRYSWAFDDNYDIFESDLKGNAVKRLTKEKGYDAEGSYSPNGQWIAFASNRSGYLEKLSDDEKKLFEKDPSSQMEIYIMKADGSNIKRLTHSLGYDGGPFFSADGTKITWRRFDSSGATAEIYTMNIDGSNQKQITHLNVMSWAPFYHPSGKYIIFASSKFGHSNFELFIVDSNGESDPVRVTNQEGFDGLASFSPDGKKMTWTHRNEKGESQIYIANWDHHLALKLLNETRKKSTLTISKNIQNKTQSELKFSKISAKQLSPNITLSDAKKILSHISSKQFSGRLPGSPEEIELNLQISELFKTWGLEPLDKNLSSIQTEKAEKKDLNSKLSPASSVYTYEFEITTGVEITEGKNSFQLSKKQWTLNSDYRPMSFSSNGRYQINSLIFAGFGIEAPATDKIKKYDSYEDIDDSNEIKGNWVVIFKDMPQSFSGETRDHFLPYASLNHKIALAKNRGAQGVIFIDQLSIASKNYLSKAKFEGGQAGIPIIEITLEQFIRLWNLSESDFDKLKIALNENKKVQIPSKVQNIEGILDIDLKLNKKIARQIIGVLKAPEKNKSREHHKSIIVGAHLDHLGHGEVGNSLATNQEQNEVHYGADDNASGVTGVLELAHYFSNKRNNLKHDIYFALWSAEEIGILGSQSFTQRWEDFYKAKFNTAFMAGINMDMIGRLKDTLYIQGVASATEWSRLSEIISLNSELPFNLQPNPYLPTDSMSLYLKEIPSISFFTGVHSDYHTPRDTSEKINFIGLNQIITTVKNFVTYLDTNPQFHLTYQKAKGAENRNLGNGRSFRIFLGTIPDYSQDSNKGVKISGVTSQSPAEKAGLTAKDIIIELSGKKIESIHDYVYSLQTLEPKKEVPIKVIRGSNTLELKITPEIKE